jgi:hypothetical protein
MAGTLYGNKTQRLTGFAYKERLYPAIMMGSDNTSLIGGERLPARLYDVGQLNFQPTFYHHFDTMISLANVGSATQNLVTTVSPPTLVSGIFSRGLLFTAASSQYLEYASSAYFTTTGSISCGCIFKLNSLPTAGNDMMLFMRNAAGNWGFFLDVVNTAGTITGRCAVTTTTPGVVSYTATTATVGANQWYSLIGVYDDSAKTVTAYLNGRPGTPVATGSTLRQSADVSWLGRLSAGSGYFDGIMDEFWIFNSVVLTSTQIAQMHGGM